MSKGLEQHGEACLAPSAEGDPPSVSGRWVNRAGTVIDLREHSDGRVNGTLRLGADGASYRVYQLRGTQITGGRGERGIVATVSGWPLPSSLTIWCAEIDAEGPSMSTKLLNADGAPLPLDWQEATGGPSFVKAPRTDRARGRRTA